MKYTNIPYVSIDSVLYELSTVIEDTQWEENRIREWAVKGYLKANLSAKYVEKTDFLVIEEHKAQLPVDIRHIIQIAYKQVFTEEDLEALKNILNLSSEAWNPSLRLIQNQEQPLPRSVLDAFYNTFRTDWKPLRLTQNTFFNTITLGAPESIMEFSAYRYNCPECNHEYSISSDGCITTSLKDGILYITYAAIAKDTNGKYLIPDNENLKEALFHYCMYRYWLQRSTRKEQNSISERNFHLKQYEVLKAKAVAEINEPSIDQMESIKNMRNRLVPRSHQYDKFFSTYTHPEGYINF